MVQNVEDIDPEIVFKNVHMLINQDAAKLFIKSRWNHAIGIRNNYTQL